MDGANPTELYNCRVNGLHTNHLQKGFSIRHQDFIMDEKGNYEPIQDVARPANDWV